VHVISICSSRQLARDSQSQKNKIEERKKVRSKFVKEGRHPKNMVRASLANTAKEGKIIDFLHFSIKKV
jgi:hypothetical protein